MKDKLISLKGGELYITSDPELEYKVQEGRAIIYIIPVDEKGGKGRRFFLYEAEPGTVIPALDYTDFDGIHWNLGIAAFDEITIMAGISDNMELQKEKFAKLIQLNNFEMEGFEEGLVEWYRLNSLKEDGYIHKNRLERIQVYESGLGLIYNLFHHVPKRLVDEEAVNETYTAMKYLCGQRGICIADYEKVRESCKDDMSVENIARVSHFISRKIVLEENWYRKDLGSLLVFREQDEKVYACIMKGCGKYIAYDPVSGEKQKVTKAFAESLDFHAYMCYRPFENEKVNLKGLLYFGLQSIRIPDMVRFLAMTLIGTLIGLLIPTLNQQLYDSFIPLGASGALLQMCCVILAFMLGNVSFTVVKNLAGFRMTSKIAHDVQCATYDRVFNLPESFFRNYDSGDLGQRVMETGSFVNGVISLLLSAVMTGVFCVVYAGKMIGYSGFLSIVAMGMLVVYVITVIYFGLKTVKYEREMMETGGRVSSVMYQLLAGISKIRIAGAEDRALYEYLKPYINLREKAIKSEKIELFINVFSMIMESMFSIVLYILVIQCDIGISLGTFLAFSSAFGSFSASVLSLADSMLGANSIKPAYERIQPIIETMSEFEESKAMPGDISGDIEISNVSFAYDKDGENVLSDINLHIRSGEYVALVGSSGCGKTTLLKLLLGFEKPATGKIYYDGRDIESMDKRELRKKLGVVLQDGSLISGSIYENITITAPNVEQEAVEEVIEAVGLARDISEMPMGVHTMLNEDCGTISGGQQQRILIARAIVNKPKILYFDEATSALDNITQALVCESLEKLKATRVVIAHRLSTVIHCDRIIVLDKGRIVEQGSFEELMKQEGLFYQFAKRQMV